MKEKTVVFVGGAHGSGKTTICSLISSLFGFPVIKQRHLLVETGLDFDLEWPEVAKWHDLLINQAAKKAEKFFTHNDFLLVDCHYAIRWSKALRPKKQKEFSEYIHDLDPRFVSYLSNKARTVFVLTVVDPAIAASRLISSRNSLDVEYSIRGNKLQALAERKFFCENLQRFSNRNTKGFIIETSEDPNIVIETLLRYLSGIIKVS